MFNRKLLLIAVSMLLILLLAACAIPTAQAPTTEPSEAPTEAEAEPTEAAAAATTESEEPTPTAEPTEAPTLEPIEPYVSPRENPVVVAAPRIIGYFSSWAAYGRAYHVRHVETSGSAAKLNVINYAFGAPFQGKCLLADPSMDVKRIYGAVDSVDGEGNGQDTLRGHWGQLVRLKAMHPGLKVLISIGGWTLSSDFSDAALPENRESFVRNCVDLFINGNVPGYPEGVAKGVFDGIDIDWEYPAVEGRHGNEYRPEDTRNFTLLLAEFRRQMDEIDPNLLLTIAAPAGERAYSKMELDKIHPYLDWINVMTYDYHGAWDATGPTNHLAPLYDSPDNPAGEHDSIDWTMQQYLAAGIPSDKITVGLPFYGRGWTGVKDENNGLYQPATDPAPAPAEAGYNDYAVLVNIEGYESFRDPITKAFWLFNGTTFWSLDDAEAIHDKMNYVKEHGLGGAMIWELASDSRDGKLITAVYDGLFGDE